MTYHTVELCCGLGAWTLSLYGLKPPASRIGAKTGYAHAISQELGVPEGERPESSLLVDSDPSLCNALTELLHRPQRLALAVDFLSLFRSGEAREVWQQARTLRVQTDLEPAARAAAWWLWTAGARGGIGGFKSKHSQRASVDGFIPSRAKLIQRIDALRSMPGILVYCANISTLHPNWFRPGALVYVDPPYPGTQGYAGPSLDPKDFRATVQSLVDAGFRVAVSSNKARRWPGWRDVDITSERRGQTRRSLTKSVEEWLTIGGR